MPKKNQSTGSDYEVGFAKPPKATRFVKGQSGNPNGRPKGSLSFASILNKALFAKVVVNEGSQKIARTKLEVMLIQALNKAVAGDLKAAQFISGFAPVIDKLNQEAGLSPDQAMDINHAKEIARRFVKSSKKGSTHE